MKVGDLVDENDKLYETVETPVTSTDNPDDPYDSPEETEETSDVINDGLFKWSGKGGLFSTWRERHVFLRGFRNGFGTKLFEKFPECPAMWNDDAHYYESGQELGYVIKIGIQISAVWIFTQLGVMYMIGGGDPVTTVVTNKETITTILQSIIGMLGK